MLDLGHIQTKDTTLMCRISYIGVVSKCSYLLTYLLTYKQATAELISANTFFTEGQRSLEQLAS